MDKKFIILMLFMTGIVIALSLYILTPNSTSRISTTEEAKAYTIEPTSFDWGNIPYEGEKATKSFTIRNEGTETLKIYDIRTSCHCTVARASVNGVESQNFGMSGVSSWVGEVPPGNEAKLIVVFDQKYHGPQGVGPITRFVSVKTNDKNTPELTFTLTGNVVK